jgi:alpha-ketoglutarate-dependent taurine dioxygenase
VALQFETGFFGDFGCLIPRQGRQDILEIDSAKLHDLMKVHGAVLLRGFEMSSSLFKGLTDKFSSSYITHINPQIRPSTDEDKTISGVLKGNDMLHLHGEMFYLPQRPASLWLYCIVPPQKDAGGETLLCSGTSLLLALKPEIRAIFERKKLKYTIQMKKSQWQAAYGVDRVDFALDAIRKRGINSPIRIMADDSLIFETSAPAIQSTWNNRRAFINSLLDWYYMHTRSYGFSLDPSLGFPVEFEDGPIPKEVICELELAADKTTRLVKWEAGDVIVVDNTWVMHGRNAFTGPREILTRFTAPEAAQVQRKAG